MQRTSVTGWKVGLIGRPMTEAERIKELEARVAELEAALATCDEARALLKESDQ